MYNLILPKITVKKKSQPEVVVTGKTPLGTLISVPTVCHTKYETKLLPLPEVKGVVSREKWNEALSVYENNQVYYQDRLEDGKMSFAALRSGLTTLEHWFACVLEPVDEEELDSWLERQKYKLYNRVTIFCPEELKRFVEPLPGYVLDFVRKEHSGMFT